MRSCHERFSKVLRIKKVPYLTFSGTKMVTSEGFYNSTGNGCCFVICKDIDYPIRRITSVLDERLMIFNKLIHIECLVLVCCGQNCFIGLTWTIP